MFEEFMKLLKTVRPVPAGRSAGIACVVGFLFGGLGLAIYFRNVVDLILPVLVVLVAGAFVGATGWLVGALFAALYGYLRVESSATATTATT